MDGTYEEYMDDFFKNQEVGPNTPPEVEELAQSAIEDLLPRKSRKLYEKAYSDFKAWCKNKKGVMEFEGQLEMTRKTKKGGPRRRLEIGKEVAKTSKGLFSPDDWQCGKCGNVNWARRYKCNVCREPKYPRVEARTGLAGGYDDRGVVEYVRREDSDGEYDLYGRRKKRRKEEERPDLEEGEDSQEENDDGDLSKYDLEDCLDNAVNPPINSENLKT